MPKYNDRSKTKLNECHEDLQKIFNVVIQYFDNSILTGYRSKEDQDRAYEEKRSKLKYPLSMHNSEPSLAVDAAPYPIDWKDTSRFYYFAGYVMGIAKFMKLSGVISHELRWGGDWDKDTEVKDNNFNDLVHFELVVPRK